MQGKSPIDEPPSDASKLESAAKRIHEKTMGGMPDEIHTVPLSSHVWISPETVENWAKEMKALGFKEAGIFTLKEKPEFIHLAFVNESEKAGAIITEFKKSKLWFYFYSEHSNGTNIIVTNREDRGMLKPPYTFTIHDPGGSPTQLHQRLLTERVEKNLLVLTADNVPQLQEKHWAVDVAWRKKRGPSIPDIINVVRTMPPSPGEKGQPGT